MTNIRYASFCFTIFDFQRFLNLVESSYRGPVGSPVWRQYGFNSDHSLRDLKPVASSATSKLSSAIIRLIMIMLAMLMSIIMSVLFRLKSVDGALQKSLGNNPVKGGQK